MATSGLFAFSFGSSRLCPLRPFFVTLRVSCVPCSALCPTLNFSQNSSRTASAKNVTLRSVTNTLLVTLLKSKSLGFTGLVTLVRVKLPPPGGKGFPPLGALPFLPYVKRPSSAVYRFISVLSVCLLLNNPSGSVSICGFLSPILFVHGLKPAKSIGSTGVRNMFTGCHFPCTRVENRKTLRFYRACTHVHGLILVLGLRGKEVTLLPSGWKPWDNFFSPKKVPKCPKKSQVVFFAGNS